MYADCKNSINNMMIKKAKSLKILAIRGNHWIIMSVPFP